MATYYFSENGNDTSGDGSLSTPWKTLAKLQATLTAGDTGKLKGGDTWDETLQLDNTGTNGSPITVGGYGTGTPTIARSAESSFTLDSVSGSGPTTVNATASAFAAGDVGKFIYFATDKVSGRITAYTDADTVSVGGDFSTATASQTCQIWPVTVAGEYGFSLAGKEYVTIDGLDFDGYVNGTIDGSSNVTFQNCTFQNVHGADLGAAIEVGAWGTANGGNPTTDLTVDTCVFQDVSGTVSGTIYGTGAAGNVMDGITIKGCTIRRTNGDAMYLLRADNVLVENNTCGPGLFGFGGGHQDGINITGGTNHIIRYNTVFDYTQLVYSATNDISGDVNTGNVRIYGNVFYNYEYWTEQSGTCPGIYFDWNTGSPTSTLSLLEVFSNTFGYLGDNGLSAIFVSKAAGATITKVTSANNSFYECAGPGYTGTSAYTLAAGIGTLDIDFCNYYNTAKSSETEANSLTASDPLLTSYTGKGDTSPFDFGIGALSPCNDAGDTALTTTATVPATFVDIDGTTRTKDGGDIGAYEEAGLPAEGGPYDVVTAEVYVPGVVIGEVHTPGARAGEVNS